MNNEIDELTPEEKDALRKLSIEMEPPSQLEKKIVRALHEHDLIRVERRPFWTPIPRMVAAVATAAILFASGVALGEWWRGTPGVSDGQAKFILVLRSGRGELAGDEAARVREYGAWARELSQRGLLIDAERLDGNGYVVGSANGASAVRPADLSAPDSIQGYFLINAGGPQQALDIAAESPHVRYGSVEVRQINTGSN